MGLRHTELLAPGRVANMPPRRLLDANETDSLLSAGSAESVNGDGSYMTHSSGEENESFLEYLHEIDEEMGGVGTIGFKRAVSSLLEDKENSTNF